MSVANGSGNNISSRQRSFGSSVRGNDKFTPGIDYETLHVGGRKEGSGEN
jgi:hypothetical protein